MLRIHGEKIVNNDGLLYFNGQLFNGINYKFDDGFLLGLWNIVEGRELNRVNDIIFSEYDEIRVDASVLQKKYDPKESFHDENSECFCCLNGELFKGVSYEFSDQGVLNSENYYEYGEICNSHINYHLNGIKKEEVIADVTKLWGEDGSLIQESKFDNGKVYEIKFTSDRKLEYLTIVKGFEREFESSGLKYIALNEELNLFGLGISSSMLSLIFKNQTFSSVKIFRIENVNISEELLCQIMSSTICELNIENCPNISMNIVSKLREIYTESEIIFEV